MRSDDGRNDLLDPGRSDDQRRINVAAQTFLRRRDIVHHQFWIQIANSLPPRVFMRHLACIFNVRLHNSFQAPSSNSQVWCDEVDRYENFVQNVVHVPRRRNWFENVVALSSRHEENESRHESMGESRAQVEEGTFTFLSDTLREHLRKLKGYKFIWGARAWKHANAMAKLAGIKLASGTTDLDAICSHPEVIMAKKQRHIVSVEVGEVLLLVAFLRVFTSRRSRGVSPKICHDIPLITILMSQVHTLLSIRSNTSLEFLREWWESLNIKPPAQHACAGRKRKHAEAPSKNQIETKGKRLRRISAATQIGPAPLSPFAVWEKDEEDQSPQMLVNPESNLRMVRCVSTGSVHLIRSNGSCYCIWKYSEEQNGNHLVISTVSEERCPICFARRERELCGGSESAAPICYTRSWFQYRHSVTHVRPDRLTICRLYGGAEPSFEDWGKLPESKDPLEKGLSDLREKKKHFIPKDCQKIGKTSSIPLNDEVFWLM